VIERLFGAGIEVAEAFADPPGLSVLPAEEAIVARAVAKRRNEFVTARTLAHGALDRLGVATGPILRGEKGQPLWPREVVGTITHTDGYRAAAVAHKLAVRSVGIDAEPHDVLPDGVLDHTSLAPEREFIAASAGDDIHWDRVLFCAKETTYKAWFPLTERWLGFEDAHITFERTDDTAGTFRSRLLVDGTAIDGGAPLTEFEGRWVVDNGFILTAITLA
jgi:4'-phosphopantetheinyl transferase EntD